MTHWRSLTDREYLGAWDLPEDRVATISNVQKTALPGAGDIKASSKPVLSFHKTPKKLIVNSTIGKTIASLYGPNVEDWRGKSITLYATTTRAKGGDMVDCVRVRPEVPKRAATGVASQPVDEEMRAKQMAGAGDTHAREPGEEG